MAHQATLNHGNGAIAGTEDVIEGVSSLGNDLANLAWLQIRLTGYDLRDFREQSLISMLVVAACGVLGLAAVTVGLAGLALGLAEWTSLSLPGALMCVALGTLVLCAIAALVAIRKIASSTACFRRSGEELQRNVGWIQTVLSHSGR